VTYTVDKTVQAYKIAASALSYARRLFGHNKYLQYGGNSIDDLATKLVDIFKTCEAIQKINKDEYFKFDMELFQTAIDIIDKFKFNSILKDIINYLKDKNNMLKFTTINSIFDAIYLALEYTENYDNQQFQMPQKLKNFTTGINGFSIGKIIYKNSTELDTVYSKIDVNQIQEGLNSISSVKYLSINTNQNEELDKIIQTATLFTLAPPNKFIRPIIDDSFQLIESIIQEFNSFDPDLSVVYNVFNIEKIRHILGKIYESGLKNRFIRRSCLYKQSQISTKVEFSGGGLNTNPMINIRNILNDDITKGIELRCSFVLNDKCEFCEKFNRDKIIFKKVASKMVKKDNILEVLELMNESIDLLPVAILNKNDYHKFHIAIQNYKKIKNIF
jgi:hypothetical protein